MTAPERYEQGSLFGESVVLRQADDTETVRLTKEQSDLVQETLFNPVDKETTGNYNVGAGLTPTNMPATFRGLDEMADAHPDILADSESWDAAVADQSDRIDYAVKAPQKLIDEINDGSANARLRGARQDIIDKVDEGLERTRKVGAALREDTSGRGLAELLMWSAASLRASPFNQEAAFLDSIVVWEKHLDLARDGKFNEDAFDDEIRSVLEKGSGRPSASNQMQVANTNLLLRRINDATLRGEDLLADLHRIWFDDSRSSREVMRDVWQTVGGQGMGMDNKLLRFARLASGYHDVIIIDAIQQQTWWGANRELVDALNAMVSGDRKINLADTQGAIDGKATKGGRGLVIYEGMERSIQKRLEALYAGTGREGSIARFHWEMWVLNGDEPSEIAHETLDWFWNKEYRDGIREGRYNEKSYGVIYKLGDLAKFFIPTRFGVLSYGPRQWSGYTEQLDEINPKTGKPKERRIPGVRDRMFAAKTGILRRTKSPTRKKKDGKPADWTPEDRLDKDQPWVNDPNVNRQAYALYLARESAERNIVRKDGTVEAVPWDVEQRAGLDDAIDQAASHNPLGYYRNISRDRLGVEKATTQLAGRDARVPEEWLDVNVKKAPKYLREDLVQVKELPKSMHGTQANLLFAEVRRSDKGASNSAKAYGLPDLGDDVRHFVGVGPNMKHHASKVVVSIRGNEVVSIKAEKESFAAWMINDLRETEGIEVITARPEAATMLSAAGFVPVAAGKDGKVRYVHSAGQQDLLFAESLDDLAEYGVRTVDDVESVVSRAVLDARHAAIEERLLISPADEFGYERFGKKTDAYPGSEREFLDRNTPAKAEADVALAKGEIDLVEYDRIQRSARPTPARPGIVRVFHGGSKTLSDDVDAIFYVSKDKDEATAYAGDDGSVHEFSVDTNKLIDEDEAGRVLESIGVQFDKDDGMFFERLQPTNSDYYIGDEAVEAFRKKMDELGHEGVTITDYKGSGSAQWTGELTGENIALVRKPRAEEGPTVLPQRDERFTNRRRAPRDPEDILNLDRMHAKREVALAMQDLLESTVIEGRHVAQRSLKDAREEARREYVKIAKEEGINVKFKILRELNGNSLAEGIREKNAQLQVARDYLARIGEEFHRRWGDKNPADMTDADLLEMRKQWDIVRSWSQLVQEAKSEFGRALGDQRIRHDGKITKKEVNVWDVSGKKTQGGSDRPERTSRERKTLDTHNESAGGVPGGTAADKPKGDGSAAPNRDAAQVTQDAELLDAMPGGRDGVVVELTRVNDTVKRLKETGRLDEPMKTQGLKKMGVEYFLNNLLSGIKTHLINGIGNATNLVFRPLERAVGATIISPLTGDADMIRQELAEFASTVQFVGEGASRAKKAWKYDTPLLTEDAKIDNNNPGNVRAISSLGQGIDPGSVKGKVLDRIGAFINLPSRALVSSDEFYKSVAYLRRLKANSWKTARDKFPDDVVAQQAEVDRVMKMAQQEDAAMTLQSMRRRAIEEGRRRGYKGEQLQRYTNQWLDDNFDSAVAADVRDAVREARAVTWTTELDGNRGGWFFRNVLNDAAISLRSLTNKHPILVPVVPFVTTPMNVLNWYLDRSVGAISDTTKQLYAVARKENQMSREAQAELAGRFATGASLTALAITLAISTDEDGYPRITGHAPADKGERELWERLGIQEYSIRVGSKYISYARFEPFATHLGVIADTAQKAQDIEADGGEHNWQDWLGGMVFGLTSAIKSKSYLQGFTTLMGMINDADPFSTRTERFMQSLGGAMVPYSSLMRGTVNPGLGLAQEHFVEVRNKLDVLILGDLAAGFQRVLPNGEKALEPRRNMYGRPVKRTSFFGPDSLSPIAEREIKNDRVAMAMLDSGYSGTVPRTNYRGHDLLKFARNGQTAYDRFLELHGEITVKGKSLNGTARADRNVPMTLEQAHESLIASPEFLALSPKGTPDTPSPRRQMFQNVTTRYRQLAWEQLLQEYPDLAEEALILQAEEDAMKRGLLYLK